MANNVTVTYHETDIASLAGDVTQVRLKTQDKRCESDIRIAFEPVKYKQLVVINESSDTITMESPSLIEIDSSGHIIQYSEVTFLPGVTRTLFMLPTHDTNYVYVITSVTGTYGVTIEGDFQFDTDHYVYSSATYQDSLTVTLHTVTLHNQSDAN